MTRFETDVVCFSHLRWNFVFQRPQHLLSRMARQQRVFFVEEPVHDTSEPRLETRRTAEDVIVVVAHLPTGLDAMLEAKIQTYLVQGLIDDFGIEDFTAWYYTPMALKFTRGLSPSLVVYDCMDQLSHFKDAPREIETLERELFDRAHLVFTGGHSLYEEKRTQHPHVHAMPSSVDVPHFAQARALGAGVASAKRPRLGYVGVIDERLDLALLDAVAAMRPDWDLVMVGPVVKIDPASLPRRPNIHYLGAKPYGELPACLAEWDVALLPFARNDATRFISPTKTPEYLAAGRRVVSTSIRDVVNPYGLLGLAAIADEPSEFVARCDEALADGAGYEAWLARVDDFLADLSWDRTFSRMWELVAAAAQRRHAERALRRRTVVTVPAGSVLDFGRRRREVVASGIAARR